MADSGSTNWIITLSITEEKSYTISYLIASNRMATSNSSGILFPFFNNFCDAAPSWARTDSCGRVQLEEHVRFKCSECSWHWQLKRTILLYIDSTLHTLLLCSPYIYLHLLCYSLIFIVLFIYIYLYIYTFILLSMFIIYLGEIV